VKLFRRSSNLFYIHTTDSELNRNTSLIKIIFCSLFFFLANDLAIENNRYISSTHCIIEFDSGHVHIRDTSSNGTLINRSKKIDKNTSVI